MTVHILLESGSEYIEEFVLIHRVYIRELLVYLDYTSFQIGKYQPEYSEGEFLFYFPDFVRLQLRQSI